MINYKCRSYMNRFITGLSNVVDKCENRYGISKTSLIVGLFCSVVALFLYTPYFYYLSKYGLNGGRGVDFFSLKNNLFDAKLEEPILYYRFLLPFIAHFLNFSDFVAICIPYLTGLLSLSFLYIGLRKKLSPIISFLITLGISLTFHTSGHRFVGFSDNVCHMFSALLLFTKNPILIILYSTLGLLNDERFIFSIPFILLWHFPRLSFKESLKGIFQFSFEILVSIIIYISTRLYVTKTYSIQIPDVYGEIYRRVFIEHVPWERSWVVFFVNTFLGFRFFWIFLLFYFYRYRQIIKNTSLLSFSFFVFFTLLTIVSLLCIADVSRSLGYMYIGLVIAIISYNNYESDNKTVSMLFIVILLMIVTPVFQIHNIGTGYSITFSYPLVLDLYRLVKGT